ncbi:MAG: MG2 domain-containing protein [Leeuwenhoekiella sp.]
MKKLLFLLLLISCSYAFGQKSSYEKLWAEVDTLEINGAVVSAQDALAAIFKKSKRAEDYDQYLKAYLYRWKFLQFNTENASENILTEIDQVTAEVPFPFNAVAKSYKASFLRTYYQDNRYRISRRTTTEDTAITDFESLDADRLLGEIRTLHQQALSMEKPLSKTKIEDIEALLEAASLSRKYRPTLFDLLAHEALEFYNENFYGVTRPESLFQLTDPYLFAVDGDFLAPNFQTADSLYSRLPAIALYQKLEKLHADSGNIEALGFAQLQRLQYVANYFTGTDTQQRFRESLKDLAKKYVGEPVQGEILLVLAQNYEQYAESRGIKEKPIHPDFNKKALALSEELIEKFPYTEIAQKAASLKAKITAPSLNAQAITLLPAQAANRLFLRYSNLDTLQLQVFRVPHSFDETVYRRKDSLVLATVNAKKPMRTQKINLPQRKDFNSHSTEFVVEGLPVGKYLFFLDNPEMRSKGKFAYTTVTISDMILAKVDFEAYEEIMVKNRKTGQPIKDVIVQIFNRENHPTKTFKTDKNGLVKIKKEGSYEQLRNPKLILTKDQDSLQANLWSGIYGDDDEESEPEAKTMLFLDRAIYRPGQTVYFKGILLVDEDGKTKVVPNEKVLVYIDDANGEELMEREFTTNEYGSFSGEFKLPKSVLTGEFEIYVEEGSEDKTQFWEKISDRGDYDYSNTTFRVEEYKRPTFEVVFDELTEAYKPGDSITVSGKAAAFMGANLSNIPVKYSVKRTTNNLLWRYGNGSTPVQIATDTVFTQPDGSFKITFKASEFTEADKNTIHQYAITAVVTDVSGETQQASTSVKTGKKNLIAKLKVPESAILKDTLKLALQSENLNGNPVSAKGTLKIYKLITPERVLRNRFWEAPEIQQISRKTFIKNFPHEPYGDEPEELPKGELFYETAFESDGEKELKIFIPKKWQAGKYTAELLVTKEQDSASAKKEFSVVDPNAKYPSDSAVFQSKIVNRNFREDGHILISLQSGFKKLPLSVMAFDDNGTLFRKQIDLEGSRQLKIPVSDTKKQSIQVLIYGVVDGIVVQETMPVNIFVKQEAMVFGTKTFRNKLQPGVPETWSFVLKDSEGKTPDAEVLASMYDASLDQFAALNWQTDARFYESRVDLPSLQVGAESSSAYFISRIRQSNYSRNQVRRFDALDLFGFYFSNTNSYQYRNYLRSKIRERQVSSKVTGNVKGVVTDENGQPLPGVTVLVKGTENGTTTNFDGEFGLDAKKDAVLLFSYLGYDTTEITLGKMNNLYVMLEATQESLEEVVTVGYGTQTKKSVTGAVSTISAEYSVDDMLAGNVAGVEVVRANGAPGNVSTIRLRGSNNITEGKQPLYVVDGVLVTEMDVSAANISSISVLKDATATAIYGTRAANGVVIITTKGAIDELDQVQARTNLDETAFFFPELKTDKDGNLEFTFDTPEALTRWNFNMLAHDKYYNLGEFTGTVITQKELSIVPNAPRFLREKDTLVFTAKVSNLTTEARTGMATLKVFDAITMQPIDSLLMQEDAVRNFSAKAKEAASVSWKLIIPEGLGAVTYRVLAKAGSFTDGEENTLPVLANRMLVTESMPILVRAGETEEFTFENLKNNDSQSLEHHKFTLEYTANPAWYALQSLPYLMEFEHECSEQIFARLYANSLGAHIVNSDPKIKSVFEDWRENGGLESNLEKNEELKNIILAETLWVRDAQSETEQKSRIARLFVLSKMKEEQAENIRKLKHKQLASGAFPWFAGGRANPYITRHIVTGFGHLEKLGVRTDAGELLKSAIDYLDKEFVKDYDYAVSRESKTNFLESRSALHFLYTRSFHLDEFPYSEEIETKITKLYEKQKKLWVSKSLFDKGLLALVAKRRGDNAFAEKILTSLEQSAVKSNENGMYWKANKSGWFWYEAPIETQALIIEAFAEITDDDKTIEELKIWLLQQKRTNAWPTTKATTEAVYAILMTGGNWLALDEKTVIKVGGKKINTSAPEIEKEAGTGYLKKSWDGEVIDDDFGSIKISNKNETAGYGGAYWQYFEDLDKIKSSDGSPLQVEKTLYRKVNSTTGEKLEPITTETPLNLGDLITVQLTVKVNRTMEFLHLKDMRASGFEPTDVLSEHKYQDGTRYYQSTRDAATHFFFDRLEKGTYVLEYTVRANNSGQFSNEITTLKSMYAPEFSSHTKGIRVGID